MYSSTVAGAAAGTCVDRASSSPSPAAGSLPYPRRELGFVDVGTLVKIQVADVFLLGLAGRQGAQQRAAEERHLHVPGEAVKAEKPAAVWQAIERRVPPDRLLDFRKRSLDERVEAHSDLALPARHGREVGLHRRIAVTLRNLRIAPGKQDGRCRRPRPGFRRHSHQCEVRTSVSASSGHAAMHLPQASQAPGLTASLLPPVHDTFDTGCEGKLARSLRGKVPTTKTWVGQTVTHAALPSHRVRSTTGTKAPAGCLHSRGLGKLVLLGQRARPRVRGRPPRRCARPGR